MWLNRQKCYFSEKPQLFGVFVSCQRTVAPVTGQRPTDLTGCFQSMGKVGLHALGCEFWLPCLQCLPNGLVLGQ
jgi:hypothetical protein